MPYNATLFLLHCIENAHIGKWHCMDWHFVWNRKATNRTPLNLPPIWSMQPTKHPCNVYLQLSSSLQWTLSVHLSEWNLQRDSQCVETAKAGTGDAWAEGKYLYCSSSVWSSSFTFVINTRTVSALWSSLHSDVHLLCALQCNNVRCIATHCSEGGTGGARGRGKTSHLYWSSPGGRLFILLIVIIFVVKIIILIAMIIISHLNSSLLLTSELMTGCLYFTRKSSARFNN